MTDVVDLLLLGLTVLVASSVPFVPTGEMVGAAAALAAPSVLATLGVFGVCWLCSAVGDTVLLTAARLLRGPLQGWLDRHATGPRVEQARRWLDRSAFSAVVTARLVPGTRAPVIIALGLQGADRRRFVAADLVGCGLWAALYTLAGAVGGRLSSHPLLAVTAAVVLAVVASTVVGRLLGRQQQRAAESEPAQTS
ncbi:membrane protein DedA, SNARE-associated domain [Friedmanniella luteola]|uniref:Membrane protein DedA, SNARE-associated domain n=1 Tax=Friedmanniella luteola TaxID=546871 RepID=A0A1H1M3P2_9ACTN|nr:VTT domain-containing protein [Friedmanniella luteola]SDR81438.1 membrane protein DedA, SNARE-associated domain [Friedmanniella luteola]